MSAIISYQTEHGEIRVPCEAVLTIGRDKNSDIVIPDLMASRNHATIRRLGHADYYLIDTGSSNGSYVNRQRIAMPRLLRTGDRIQVGGSELLFTQQNQLPDRVDTLSMQETIISDAPVLRYLTVLVADIRGFTSMSEQTDIRTLTRVMNNWFQEVNEVINTEQGIVDKFIGDCVFARWENDEPDREAVIRAMRAAVRINRITEALNRQLPSLINPLRIGAGINSGMASTGIGTDNTALGDAVNLAFRLENATKLLGRDVVISESSYSCLPVERLNGDLKSIRVKGKRDPVRVCGVNFNEVVMMLKQDSSGAD